MSTKPTVPDVLGSFDAWAQIAGQLVRRSEKERQRILKQNQVQNDWEQACEKWQQAMLGELREDDNELAERYGGACALSSAKRSSEAELESDKQVQEPRSVDNAVGRQPPTVEPAPETELAKPRRIGYAPSDQSDLRRQMLAEKPPQRNAEQATAGDKSPLAPGEQFHERLGSKEAGPIEPEPDQEATLPAVQDDLQTLTSSLQRARKATSWPVDKYAMFCAQLEIHRDQQEQVWSQYGMEHDTAKQHLKSTWQQRLADSEKLQREFEQLKERYLRKLG